MKTKKLLSAVLAGIMVFGTMAMPTFAADNSIVVDDTAKTVSIADVEGLKEFANNVNNGTTYAGYTVTLEADIDLNSEPFTPIGGTNAFTGTFDGQGYTVSNLVIDSTENNVGFFGNVWQGKEIKNLNIKNANVKGGSQAVGVLLGNGAVKITNCHVSGDVSVSGSVKWVGGIAGYYYGTMSNCSIKGIADAPATVFGDKGFVGGFAGMVGENSTLVNNTVEYVNVDSNGFGVGAVAGNANYGITASDNKITNSTITSKDPHNVTGLVVGQIAGTDKLSIVANNIITESNATTTNGDVVTEVTAAAGTGGDIGNAVIGTDIVFNESGKVLSGNFEVVPPDNALAEGVVVKKDEDGNISAAEYFEAEVNNTKYRTLKEAFEAVLNSSETEVTLTLLDNVTLDNWTSVNFNKNMTFTFDGNGKTITGLNAPLFSEINAPGLENVIIKNLTIKDANITSSMNGVAAISGWYAAYDSADTLTIENVTIDGGSIINTNTSHGYAAGLIGYITSPYGTVKVTNSTVKNVTVTGTNSTGSIVGHADNIIVEAATVGNNIINTTDENQAKVGVVAGTLNSTSETAVRKFDVIEESKSTSNSPLNVLGRAYSKIEVTGGSYFTNPTVATYTDTAAELVPSVNFAIEEKDGMFGLISIGTVGSGHVKNDNGHVTVWGQTANTDPKENLYIELYSASTKLATTTLNDVEGIYAANTSDLTWHFDVAGECTDQYWTTEWVDGALKDSLQPDRVVMYVDGKMVSEDTVKMSMPDDLNPVVWAELPGVERRKIVLEATPSEVYAGDTVNVTVKFVGDKLQGADWTLTYEPTKFQYVGTTETAGKIKDVDYKTKGEYYKEDEVVRTYQFTALAQTEEVVGNFNIEDGARLQTQYESTIDRLVVPVIEATDATIKLKDYTVEVRVDDEVITTDSKDIQYDAQPHTVEIIPNPSVDSDKITFTVNGETVTDLTFTEEGTYEIAYTVTPAIGYATKTGTFTLNITKPDFKVEVNTTNSRTADYVANKKLVLAYTNVPGVCFTYDGIAMLDVSASGYKYKDHQTDAAEVEYKYVYAIVVDTTTENTYESYKTNVDTAYVEKVNPTKVEYTNNLNYQNGTDLSDVIVAYGVYNVSDANGDVFDKAMLNLNMKMILSADTNRDKFINTIDTNSVRNEAYPQN